MDGYKKRENTAPRRFFASASDWKPAISAMCMPTCTIAAKLIAEIKEGVRCSVLNHCVK